MVISTGSGCSLFEIKGKKLSKAIPTTGRGGLQRCQVYDAAPRLLGVISR
jgi:hypothetical protein